MSKSHTKSHNCTDATVDPWPGETVRNCKDDALSDREFERMVEATYRLDDDYVALECRMILFAAGRLGMRSGEIVHMRADWIDWRRDMITIPRHERCTKGRDGGICGACRQAARQMADYNADLSLERAQSVMWKPKTSSAAREIPIDATTRAAIAIEEYFDRFDEFTVSQTGVNRRVEAMADVARGVDAEDVYPHALRSTAASFFAARDLNVTALKSMMGWSDFSTAVRYLEESGERTAIALRDIQV